MENYEKNLIGHINAVAKKRRDDFEECTAKALENPVTISELENIWGSFSCPAVHRSEFSVDDIPLTRAQYENAKKILRDTCDKANVESNKAYNRFHNKAKEKFKDILRNDSFSYKGKNKKEVFNVIFNRAWEEAHGEGLKAVSNKFDDLDDFVNDIFQAANG
ncbi:hypothetical protein ACTNDZ_12115 [Selenomonas montiformis]|uniref:hypothetical protein n=1 Tax=Selenomonas montiformis TaxID=2652285 RepID=UPI003F893646